MRAEKRISASFPCGYIAVELSGKKIETKVFDAESNLIKRFREYYKTPESAQKKFKAIVEGFRNVKVQPE